MLDFACLADWNTVAGVPGVPVYWCPVSGIRYPVPSMAVELVKTGPKWPKKVCLTLPKGLGPLLKEVTFDPGGTGLKLAKTAENG